MGVLLSPRLYNYSFISSKRDCLILCTNNIDFPFCNSFLIAFYFPYAFLYTINESRHKKKLDTFEYIKAFSIKYYSHSICPLISFCINGVKSGGLLSNLALLSILFLFLRFFASILQARNYSLSNDTKHSS